VSVRPRPPFPLPRRGRGPAQTRPEGRRRAGNLNLSVSTNLSKNLAEELPSSLAANQPWRIFFVFPQPRGPLALLRVAKVSIFFLSAKPFAKLFSLSFSLPASLPEADAKVRNLSEPAMKRRLFLSGLLRFPSCSQPPPGLPPKRDAKVRNLFPFATDQMKFIFPVAPFSTPPPDCPRGGSQR